MSRIKKTRSFRLPRSPNQPPERQEDEVESGKDGGGRCADCGKRHGTGNGPGDERGSHDRAVFEVKGESFLIGIFAAAELLGQKDGQGLVAGDDTGEDGCDERRGVSACLCGQALFVYFQPKEIRP